MGWLDHIDEWVLFVGLIAIFLAVSGVAFLLARRTASRLTTPLLEGKRSQAGLLLGALLGLVALLMAFSFGVVETRFSARKQLVIRDANAIGTTYLRAAMLPEPERSRVRALLKEYVDIRIGARTPESLAAGLERSSALQIALWTQAVSVAQRDPRSIVAGLFVSTLNDMIDVHEERVATGLYLRLPFTLLATVFALALLSMSLLGHSAGLSGVRATIPTVLVALSIAAVMLLIVDLDRPWQQLFGVSQRALRDTQEMMLSYDRRVARSESS